MINVGYEGVKIGKGHTLAYLIHTHNEPYATDDKYAGENAMHNISAEVSDMEVEMLPAVPINSKMTFPGDHTPVRKVVLQEGEI